STASRCRWPAVCIAAAGKSTRTPSTSRERRCRRRETRHERVQRMSRVAVTGGSGFIAGWCIAQLLDEGHDVVATIRSPQREPEVRAAAGDTSTGTLSFAIADLSSDDSWDDAFAGC